MLKDDSSDEQQCFDKPLEYKNLKSHWNTVIYSLGEKNALFKN